MNARNQRHDARNHPPASNRRSASTRRLNDTQTCVEATYAHTQTGGSTQRCRRPCQVVHEVTSRTQMLRFQPRCPRPGRYDGQADHVHAPADVSTAMYEHSRPPKPRKGRRCPTIDLSRSSNSFPIPPFVEDTALLERRGMWHTLPIALPSPLLTPPCPFPPGVPTRAQTSWCCIDYADVYNKMAAGAVEAVR